MKIEFKLASTYSRSPNLNSCSLSRKKVKLAVCFGELAPRWPVRRKEGYLPGSLFM